MPCGEPDGGPEPSPERVVGEGGSRDAAPERLLGEGVGDADPCADGNRGPTGGAGVRQPFGGDGAQGRGNEQRGGDWARLGQHLFG
jgi:hypothetical protein